MINQDLTLCIETAVGGGSLALLCGENARAVWRGDNSFAHSSGLLGEINNLYAQSGFALDETRQIAVAVGPGSFTGLRVGLATAKGLAAALQIPLAGVPTLAALSESSAEPRIAAVIPAGHNNVFAQIFVRNDANRIEPQTDLITGTLPNVFNRLDAPPVIVAPPELHDEIEKYAVENRLIPPRLTSAPENLAVCVGRAAANSLESFDNNVSLIYGRDADARKPNR